MVKEMIRQVVRLLVVMLVGQLKGILVVKVVELVNSWYYIIDKGLVEDGDEEYFKRRGN